MGFTTLVLLWVIKPAIEPQQEALYHWSASAGNFLIPVAIDFLGVWLILAVMLVAARTAGRFRTVLWGGLLLFTPWFLVLTLHRLSLLSNTDKLERYLFLAAFVLTAWITLAWRPSLAARCEKIIEPASTVLLFAGFFGIFVLAQLAFRGGQSSRITYAPPLPHVQSSSTRQPHRIIWIVFDELSYQQTYEHRFPNLQLPAFDSMAAEATVFTHAQPFDIYTQAVLPGLFAGQPFDKITTAFSGDLSVHNQLTSKWQTFQQHDTVFQDARNTGYRTAVVGWYNPYCRILSAVVDNCNWTFHSYVNLMEPSNSILANALAPIKILAWRALAAAPGPVFFYSMNRLHLHLEKYLFVQSHIDDYKELVGLSDKLLRDPYYTFLFLHLPAPHPTGIYDRRTGEFSLAGASYIDNLALTDKCLAGIRHTLEETNQWDSSTVVIMGDHSWRTAIWRIENGWSPEDELASHRGQYDPRPVYLIKLPNQTTPARIDAPFQTLNTRRLFDALMAHQIQTPADLATWAQTTH